MSGLTVGGSPLQMSQGLPAAHGLGTPTMQGDGFSWYGGQPTVPEGGQYNQMAQMMAGPSYAPPGANFYSGLHSPAMGGKGASPIGAGKGMSPGTSSIGHVPPRVLSR